MTTKVPGRILMCSAHPYPQFDDCEPGCEAENEYCDFLCDIGVSLLRGVWLVGSPEPDGAGQEYDVAFAPSPEGAALATSQSRKERGEYLPELYRVYPLAEDRPISLTDDTSEEMIKGEFNDACVEVRL